MGPAALASRTQKAHTFRRATILFACVYVFHAGAPVSVQGDSRWTIPTALSLLDGHGGDLRGYGPILIVNDFYEIECVQPDHSRLYPMHSLEACHGRLYSFYPVAVAVLAVPFVEGLQAVVRIVGPVLRWPEARPTHSVVHAVLTSDFVRGSPIVENLIAAVFTAGAATLLYLTVATFQLPAAAMAIALLFSFGTLLWSLVSRALWTHAPSIFLNSLLLLLLVREKYSRLTMACMGLVLALAFFVRPTNAVPVLIIGGFLITRLGTRALWVLAGGLPATLFFVVLNLHMYGGPLAPVFFPVREGSTRLSLQPSVATGIAANLVSPARGLFVFMPFFLFLLVPEIWRTPVSAKLSKLRLWLCGVVALHMLLVATHTDWWGGFSYGPRYLSDVLPYLMLLWSPVLVWMEPKRWRRLLVIASVAVSIFIQYRGATSIQVHHWNATPVSVNDDRGRIWDWHDPPFLRGLR